MSAALELQDVSKRFGGLQAVQGLSFRVEAGEIVGLIGPNGAGKTTTVNLVTGFQRPDTGDIRFGGDSVAGRRPHQVSRRGLCKTSQVAQPFGDMTVLENATVGALAWTSVVADAREAAADCLERTGLAQRGSARARDLTTIDQRRLEVARALATRPRMLLLDETMAGLNSSEIEIALDLVRSLREAGLTLLVIEHNIQAILSISDRVVAMDHGRKIAEGAPRDVVRDEAVVTAYLGVQPGTLPEL